MNNVIPLYHSAESMENLINNQNRELKTFRDICKIKLESIYNIIDSKEHANNAINVFNLIAEPWASFDISRKWENDIIDDGSPFELSINFKGNTSTVRLLVEPQHLSFNRSSNWTAGLALKEKIKEHPDVEISKLNSIIDIFAPQENVASSFSIWYAAILNKECPHYKVYLNPQIRGEKKSSELIKQALYKLNMKDAWEFLSQRLETSNEYAKIPYFSLDMFSGAKARTKVYIANKYVKNVVAQLEGCCNSNMRHNLAHWIKTLTSKEDFFNQKPLLTHFAFSEEHSSPVATVYIPVSLYIKNDSEILDRLDGILNLNQKNLLTKVLEGLIQHSSEKGKFLTYISLQQENNGQMNSTFYLSPAIYSVNK